MTKVIARFKEKYFFLSNFYASPILHDGILYPTNEHFFQAMKTEDEDLRYYISMLETPNKAKVAGRKLELRPDWEEIKDKVMWTGINHKFKIEALATCLLNTGNAMLIEGNWWGDKYWGVYNGQGLNKLGIMLMRKRDKLLELGGTSEQ